VTPTATPTSTTTPTSTPTPTPEQPVKLFIGNKNYSSWSLRPWIVMTQAGIPFEEEVIPLDQPTSAAGLRRASPSGRVPCLVDGEVTVWDSLAICEYLAERFPERRLWPADAAARATARSISAEMHSGFQNLRTQCPMKFRETIPAKLSPEVKAEVSRIVAIWEECRRRFGQGGPFLFGDFSIADAFYAPVVSRFRTYGVAPGGAAGAYADAIWNLAAMQRWGEAARAETWSMARYATGPKRKVSARTAAAPRAPGKGPRRGGGPARRARGAGSRTGGRAGKGGSGRRR